MTKPIDPAGFEAKFRADDDPWNYRSSPFERHKRRMVLRACGLKLRGNALELACANGETTWELAPRCLRLTALDASPTAVAAAHARVGDRRNVTLGAALLPDEMPRSRYDLVVLSELAYYLSRRDLEILLERAVSALRPGGRLVSLHHIRPFDDAAQPPARAHALICRILGARMIPASQSAGPRFRCVAFDKRRIRRAS
ncbi:SAM-dependent methyltransferase [Aurantimonas sp. VKM B-3413]|uniref:SAM-dependent methyltransferase n=1 Tax=Aurantimonas sp. VKM B-3413 TaxID=2779401 RepID=UPI001E3D0D0D|nr:SAM-dependent methyltransferase [Aurantimonas sp. VKM B-3413]MCB8837962.1 nodulation S family protein [Aurantimonas sp. VKM B-3413]